MRDVVGQQRGSRGRRSARVARRDQLRVRCALRRPRIQPAIGSRRSQRVERGLVRTEIEDAWAGLLLRTSHLHGTALDQLSHLRRRVVEVADQDGLGRAHGDARGFEADIESVGAHVALLGRVILGVDEDGVVRTSRHTGLATDADGLVEVDDAVLALEHGLSRTRRDARCIGALIAAGDLEGPPNLREDSDVDRLDVGTGHAQRNLVLALTGCRARVAADASALVKDLYQTTRLLDLIHRASIGRTSGLDTSSWLVSCTFLTVSGGVIPSCGPVANAAPRKRRG